MRIEIKAQDDSGLSQEVYIFEVSQCMGWGTMTVRFTDYYRQHRKTKRHRNWDTSAFWTTRPNGGGMYSRLMVDKPKVPAAVETRMKYELSNRTEYDL